MPFLRLRGLGCALLVGMLLLSRGQLVRGEDPARPAAAKDAPLFTFVHLTDTHCFPRTGRAAAPPLKARIQFGGLKFYWADTGNSLPRLDATVARLNSVVRPDLVLHTGDVATGVANLALAKASLDGLACPYRVLMGDNDMGKPKAQFLKAPDDCEFVRVFGPRRQTCDQGGWRFILLSEPTVAADLEWLETQLAEAGERPVVLCTHRLVVADEVTASLAASVYAGEALLTDYAAEIRALIEKHPAVVLVLCGHCHCDLQWTVNGIRYYTTAALVGTPASFRVFRVYADRIEMTSYAADTLEAMQAGRWRAGIPETIMLRARAASAAGDGAE